MREGSGTRAGLYRPPGRSKFGSTSCATLSPCPGCSGSVGTAGIGRVFLVCVPVGEPWFQGRWGSTKNVLEGSLAACENLFCDSSSSDQIGPLSCGGLQMSLPVWDGACAPQCQLGGECRIRGFGKLHQTQCRRNQPFSPVSRLQFFL